MLAIFRNSKWFSKKEKLIQHPETGEFLRGAQVEAAYQRETRPNQDKEKTDATWYWTLGKIVGKSLDPHVDDFHKLHHIEAGAALLANWHAAIKTRINDQVDLENQ